MTAERVDDLSLADRMTPVRYTEREFSVLCLVATGLTNAEVATRLRISRHTVAQHIATMLRAADARSRAELVARAYCGGLLRTGTWPPELHSRRDGRKPLLLTP